jgi:hypothetical protein
MSRIANLDEKLHRVGYDSTLRCTGKPDTFAELREISQVEHQALACAG